MAAAAAETTTPLYRARVLPGDEWAARAGELAHYTAGLPDPEFSILVVVEDTAGRIVASWLAMNTVHLEGLYVDPAHRHTAPVARELLAQMVGELISRQIPAAVTIAQDPAIAELAEHAGFVQIPGTLWQLTLPQAGG